MATGIMKSHHIDGAELAMSIINMSHLDMLRREIRGLLGDHLGQFQIDILEAITNMKRNSLAKAEAKVVADDALCLIATLLSNSIWLIV